jgi:hypothetical protein
MKPLRIVLAVAVLLIPSFAQQINTNVIPASPGLNVGTPAQRWNGNFQNLDVTNLTVNGQPPSFGGGFNCGTTANPGIPLWNGTACVVDTNATDDGNGNFSLASLTTTTSITTPVLNTTGVGFVWNFKTQTAPGPPQSGFMEWYGDSGTNKWTCLNSDGSSCAPSGAGSLTVNTNGSANTSQSLLNFTNPSSFDGLTFTFSNPSSGNETFAVGGTLGNAGLTNSSTTVNGQTCTLGSSCSVAGSAPTFVLGSSDTLTAAGTFATQASITAGSTSFFEIRAHGVLSTTATASPLENMQVNAFGTTGICNHGVANNSLLTNLTNNVWDVVCYVGILTTGAPGTASTGGSDVAATGNTNGVFVSKVFPQNSATVPATTTTAQTVSIQLVSTPVSGQSFTLQWLSIRGY